MPYFCLCFRLFSSYFCLCFRKILSRFCLCFRKILSHFCLCFRKIVAQELRIVLDHNYRNEQFFWVRDKKGSIQQLRQTTAATLLINKTLFTKFHNILLVLFEKKSYFCKEIRQKNAQMSFQKKNNIACRFNTRSKKTSSRFNKKANET